MKKIVYISIFLISFLAHVYAQRLEPMGTFVSKKEGVPFDLDVSEKYAFIALGEEGLVTLDISDPKRIERVSAYTESEMRGREKVMGTANGVKVKGNLVYLAYGNLGLKIIDISSPEYPKTIGTYYKYQWVYSVDVYDNFAFLGLKSDGMHVVDISNPPNLDLVSKKNVKDFFVKDVCISKGLYVITAGSEKGLIIFNYKLPLNSFVPMGFPTDFKTEGCAEEIIVAGRYAFLANGPAGFAVLDINLPSYPEWEETIKTHGVATGLAVVNESAFVANGGNITIFNIYEPKNPFEVGVFEKGGVTFTKVRAKGNNLYATFYNKNNYWGIIVLQIRS